MGNLRTIKKDVEYLIGEVVDDCFIYLEINNYENKEKVSEIINDALDAQDELIDKINHRPDEIKAKTYYKGITEELVKAVDGCYERLSGLSDKKEKKAAAK